LRICLEKLARLSAKRESKLHERNEPDRNEICLTAASDLIPTANYVTGAVPHSIALGFGAVYFLPSTFLRLSFGHLYLICLRSPMRGVPLLCCLHRAFITLLDVMGFPLLFGRVFLFASLCHRSSI